jgi:hypothetical protein
VRVIPATSCHVKAASPLERNVFIRAGCGPTESEEVLPRRGRNLVEGDRWGLGETVHGRVLIR